MKPATSLCSWRDVAGTRRCTSKSPATATSTDTQTTIRPGRMPITAGVLPGQPQRDDGPRLRSLSACSTPPSDAQLLLRTRSLVRSVLAPDGHDVTDPSLARTSENTPSRQLGE